MISYTNIISKNLCKHNKIKYECIYCTSKKNICYHNKIKINCKECKIIEICMHNNFKSYCKICKLYIKKKKCQLYKMKISNLINI